MKNKWTITKTFECNGEEIVVVLTIEEYKQEIEFETLHQRAAHSPLLPYIKLPVPQHTETSILHTGEATSRPKSKYTFNIIDNM
jgi:hypothetical protein